MNISELFQRYRKTEPSSVMALRSFIMLLILVLLIFYTIKLSFDVVNEIPSIVTSYEKTQHLSIPGNFRLKHSIITIKT